MATRANEPTTPESKASEPVVQARPIVEGDQPAPASVESTPEVDTPEEINGAWPEELSESVAFDLSGLPRVETNDDRYMHAVLKELHGINTNLHGINQKLAQIMRTARAKK